MTRPGRIDRGQFELLHTITDDDPGMARRIVAVARPLNPTMRIVVRVRYHSDAESLLKADAAFSGIEH